MFFTYFNSFLFFKIAFFLSFLKNNLNYEVHFDNSSLIFNLKNYMIFSIYKIINS